MEEYSRKDEHRPQLLDLIPRESTNQWVLAKSGEEKTHFSSEENELELRLGPPCQDWSIGETEHSILSLDSVPKSNIFGLKRGFMNPFDHKAGEENWVFNKNGNQTRNISCLENQEGDVSSSPWAYSGLKANNHQKEHPKMAPFFKISSNPQAMELQNAEKITFSPASANTAVPNSSQKRSAPTPVVGWPPIRSFRKNLASNSSSKPIIPSKRQDPDATSGEKKEIENNNGKGLFVKINMDGVPIGRKVDLKSYDSYEKLSSAVDQLFRGLLAAQTDYEAGESKNKKEGEKATSGLIVGKGEYTLVYEDNEGDRMLVGDVPWQMFVSTVKRLRVLKSSDIPTLRRRILRSEGILECEGSLRGDEEIGLPGSLLGESD